MLRILLILFLIPSALSFSEYTLREGKLLNTKLVASLPIEEHYKALVEAHERQQWKRLEKEALLITRSFAGSLYARDAGYFLGVAHFHQNDFEVANTCFTRYLTRQTAPKYFNEVINFKFEIAEKFRLGARKHLMGLKGLPKWVSDAKGALEFYDEVISALPHSDIAAHSLFGKALIQASNEDFRAAIQSYQTLIRRFSKHPLAIESYIGVGKVYLAQSKREYPDPDYLDLDLINLRKFRTSFPGEEKLVVAQQNVARMEEYYAGSFFDTARFYERTKKWGAAKIYYSKILKAYPNSQIASKSKQRLRAVEEKLDRLAKKKSR